MLKNTASLGDIYDARDYTFINRTGATLYRGELAMLDFENTSTAATALTPGEASVFATLTPVVQAEFDEGFPVVVAAENIANGAKGRCYVCGVIQVAVCDDDASTTDVDVGDAISMLVTDNALSAVAYLTSTSFRKIGIALETAAASGGSLAGGEATLKTCLFWGGIPGAGVSDDAS